MRISDWSSDVCSSDLAGGDASAGVVRSRVRRLARAGAPRALPRAARSGDLPPDRRHPRPDPRRRGAFALSARVRVRLRPRGIAAGDGGAGAALEGGRRSEGQTYELQSLMRISYAVLCLKKK